MIGSQRHSVVCRAQSMGTRPAGASHHVSEDTVTLASCDHCNYNIELGKLDGGCIHTRRRDILGRNLSSMGAIADPYVYVCAYMYVRVYFCVYMYVHIADIADIADSTGSIGRYPVKNIKSSSVNYG